MRLEEDGKESGQNRGGEEHDDRGKLAGDHQCGGYGYDEQPWREIVGKYYVSWKWGYFAGSMDNVYASVTAIGNNNYMAKVAVGILSDRIISKFG